MEWTYEAIATEGTSCGLLCMYVQIACGEETRVLADALKERTREVLQVCHPYQYFVHHSSIPVVCCPK